MMFSVFKYAIPVAYEPVVPLRKGAKILSVGAQGVHICLWALVDMNEVESEDVKLRVVGTGHPIDGIAGEFLGTVIFPGDQLVFHVFKAAQDTMRESKTA